MRSGASCIRAESGGRGTCGDTGFGCPEDGFFIVGSSLDIRERIACACRLRTSGGAPEESHNLRSGAARVRTECGCGGAGGNLVHDRPVDHVMRPVALCRHIREDIAGTAIPAVTGFVGLWLVKLRRSNLLSLRCKRRILERRGIGDFALLVIGSFLGHLGGRGGDFVLDMTCVVLADTAGCHGVVVLAPCVGRRIPVVDSCRKLSMLTGQFGVTNGAVDYQFFRAENSSGQ